MRRISFILFLLLLIAIPTKSLADESTTKKERNFIKHGNELYEKKQYAEAAEEYRNALNENMTSEVATFNLAAALVNMSPEDYKGDQKDAKTEAANIFSHLAANAISKNIATKSLYNLGNLAFNDQQYQKAIEYYKEVLRKDPNNDKARQNLRLAQLQQQDQQDQNQDQQQQQDQQDQNQDQNQNQQDQDQNQDQNQDQDQQQQQQDQQQQQQQDQQQQQQQQQGISDENAEKMLKSVENQENITRQRINQEQEEDNKRIRVPVTDKPW